MQTAERILASSLVYCINHVWPLSWLKHRWRPEMKLLFLLCHVCIRDHDAPPSHARKHKSQAFYFPWRPWRPGGEQITLLSLQSPSSSPQLQSKTKPLSLTSTLLYKAVLSLFFHKLMIGGGDQYINGTVFMSAASLCVDAVWVIATA